MASSNSTPNVFEDPMPNLLILATEGILARAFIYINPICPLIADYFDEPLFGFKLVMIQIHHSKICKSIVQALLVLNRMTCVLFPISHDYIWSKSVLRALIPFIFLLPLSVDWNLAISRVYMEGYYGGAWVDYIKKVKWASQSRFQLLFITIAMSITLVGTFLTLMALAKLPERVKNLERAILHATWIISIGFSGTAAFQVYYAFFWNYLTDDPIVFALNFLSWDFLIVGSPIVMLCVSSTLRKHVFGLKDEESIENMFQVRSRTI